jgi:hypothetical protein
MSTVALVGYDRKTEYVGVERDIPAKALDYAKARAKVQADDPDVALSYPLDAEAAKDIAGAIGLKIDTGACDFFLEGFSD